AAEVHVRVSTPPVLWPCCHGVDFATRAELIAANLSVEEITGSLNADSLAHVSLEQLTAATRRPENQMGRACFDAHEPETVDTDARGEYLLEKSCGSPVVAGEK